MELFNNNHLRHHSSLHDMLLFQVLFRVFCHVLHIPCYTNLVQRYALAGIIRVEHIYRLIQ